MKQLLYILAIITILSSCDKVSTLDLPTTEPQMVVTYFVGPSLYSDTTYLNLDWSIPIYDNPNYEEQLWRGAHNSVEWADVTITNNGKILDIPYDDRIKVYYNSKTNFEAGDEVELNANYNNEEEISSSCIVPEKPIFDIEDLGEEIATDGESYQIIKFTSKNEGNNYFKFYMNTYKTETVTKYWDENLGEYVDTIYQRVIENSVYLNDPVTILNKNESITFTTQMTLGIVCNEKVDSVIAHILNIDENYYKFEKMPKDTSHEDGIYLLFMSEPELDFSNIDGGLGIFCAFNIDAQTIVMK